MKKSKKEQYFYCGISIVLCLFLITAMLSLMVPSDRSEHKHAKPGGKVIEESMEDGDKIRVVLKTNGFKNIEHGEINIASETGFTLHFRGEDIKYSPNENLRLTPNDEKFGQGSIWIIPDKDGKTTILSLDRGCGHPSYRGKIELFSTGRGIVAVNEIPVEQYLYGVVPSEMPSSYEKEALKAQAVCARSYAARQMLNYAYPDYHAHVDDSTEFQVYGNSQEKNSTVNAVDETKGQKVWYNDDIITTYYFSTSGGSTTTTEAWGSSKNESNTYLKSVSVSDGQKDYEKNLPWYRWTAEIDRKTLSELIRKNTKTDIGEIKDLKVTKRGGGNVALQIVATGSKGEVTVDTENKIRRALGGKGYRLKKQDGTESSSKELLPSAFFDIEKKSDTYIIKGGGFGHGIGMSQNGANEMAKSGKTHEQILQFFYSGIVLK